MGKLILALAISFIVAVGLGSAAHSAPQCNERDNVHKLLAKKYGETTSAIGVANTGGLIEVLHDPKDGSWTILMTTPQGTSCMVASGEGWRNMQQLKIEPGA